MSQRVSVGDPAASSLSSSLCAFPGGFSLLTETGRLRPYLVFDTRKDDHTTAAVAVPEVVAAAPVHLCSPSPQGLFPVDEDVPVHHSWSRDGRVLVVLRRSSFTVYHCCRDFQRSSGSNDGNGGGGRRCQGPARPRGVVGPSLGLEEVHTGRTDFGGKVVSCCSIDVPAAAAAAAAELALATSGGTDDRPTYLIAIGGTYGIECHAVEVSAAPRSSADTTTTMAKDKRQVEQQPARGPLPGKGRPLKGQALTADTEEEVQSAAAAAATAPAAAATATCRPLTTLFRGYPVVALAFSPNSSLMAAASMTGHVSVWDVASVADPAPAQQQEDAPTRREPVKRGRGDRKKGLEGLLSATPPPRQIDSAGTAALWGVAVRAWEDEGAVVEYAAACLLLIWMDAESRAVSLCGRRLRLLACKACSQRHAKRSFGGAPRLACSRDLLMMSGLVMWLRPHYSRCYSLQSLRSSVQSTSY